MIMSLGVDPDAYLQCQDRDEQRIWEEIAGKAQEFAAMRNEDLATMIINKLAKAMKSK